MNSQRRAIAIFFLLTSFLISSCGSGQLSSPTLTETPTLVPTAAPTIQPGDSERKLTVNGVERSYLLHIPPGLDSLHPAPVVFVFHGLGVGSMATSMPLLTGFSEIADGAGFLVVYPNGIGLSWNAGSCCAYAVESNVDEPAFVRQMISDLETVASIDTKRIYATGLSNGAGLVYRLGCEMSDTFAAIAPVSGALMYSPCQPQQAVSLIHVHGLKDTATPYAGGGRYNIPPVEQMIATWVQLDGCTGSAQVEQQGSIITHTSYASCQADAAVELYTIGPGGQEWPSKYVWPASQIIWDFFAAHPKP